MQGSKGIRPTFERGSRRGMFLSGMWPGGRQGCGPGEGLPGPPTGSAWEEGARDARAARALSGT